MSHTKSPGRPWLAALLCLALPLLAGCAQGDNAPSSQVAGANTQQIYGYLMDINEQARTITIDSVEMYNNTERQQVSNVGQSGSDLANGGYFTNESVQHRIYALHPQATFDLDSAYTSTGAGNATTGYGYGAGETANNSTLGTGSGLDASYGANSTAGPGGYGNGNTGLGLNSGSDLSGNAGAGGLANSNGNEAGMTSGSNYGTGTGMTSGGNYGTGAGMTDGGNYGTGAGMTDGSNYGTGGGLYNDGLSGDSVSGETMPYNDSYGLGSDQSLGADDYFGRLTIRLREQPEILYCFTVEDNVVTAVRDCSDLL